MTHFTAEDWIDILDLEPHPEGGAYREIYRSAEMIAQEALAPRFGGDSRDIATAIHYLLRGTERSVLHRLKSDELWFWHAGCAATLTMIERNGTLHAARIGPDVEIGEQLAVTVPAGCWFGLKPDDPSAYILASCVVAPGFDFRDFELGSRDTLLRLFPQHADIIRLLTK